MRGRIATDHMFSYVSPERALCRGSPAAGDSRDGRCGAPAPVAPL